MDLDDLARHVGLDRFQGASVRAVATAAGTGGPGGRGADTDEAMVPHELADLVEGDLDLAIALYRVMPCYANLMYVGFWAPRADLLAEVAALLDEAADTLADPAAYWLWCGPFEECETESAAAWQVVCTNATDRRLHRLLPISGPVPWPAKGPLLESLADAVRWHPAIWQAVQFAARDVYGRVDAEAGRRLLDRLTAPPAGIEGDELRRRLDRSG